MTRNDWIVGLSTLLLGIFSLGFAEEGSQWQKISSGINEPGINEVAIDPNNKQIIYAGTDSGLYVSEDGGADFSGVIEIQGKRNKINAIFIQPDNQSQVFVATDSGLFTGNIREGRWQKIYDGGSQEAGICLDVLGFDTRIYLGTGRGLFFKEMGAQGWQRVPGNLGNEIIYDLAQDGAYLYAAGQSELYRLDSRGSIEKVFTVFSGYEEDDRDYEETVLPPGRIKDLFVLPAQRPVVYLCQEDKIFFSDDHGDTWQRFETNGQVPGKINAMLAVQNMSHGIEAPMLDMRSKSNWGPHIFLATDKGLYKFQQNRWQEMYRGLEDSGINAVVSDDENRLYAATEGGLFFMPLEKAVSGGSFQSIDYDGLRAKFEREPSIQEVHRLASHYAEVNKEKIDDWRRRAAKKPWLPDVSIGLNGDKNKTLGDSVWGSYTSGGQLFIGPDDKTFYDNFGWDVSLSWDLGDIIWNSDQTSIDSRSKMMVELREDILDQITRLYFERRRLQFELAAGEGPAAAYAVFDKKMRIEELTALIDALTGGEFTRRIKANANSSN